MNPICFSVNGTEYRVQDAAGTNHKEIVDKNTGVRVENEKQVCRDYGINVSTSADVMNTHQAIEELIQALNLRPPAGTSAKSSTP
ncbi:hypothetical protein FACS189473_4790 [Spirochaetia bacterium]|nr:hypothetical protein FACS189473_4790 [Spirochaetia bacterium]